MNILSFFYYTISSTLANIVTLTALLSNNGNIKTSILTPRTDHKAEEIDKSVLDFLTSSVLDAQATIRALDVKTNYLLVVLTVPLLKLGNVYDICKYLYLNPAQNISTIFLILSCLFGFFWIAAYIAAFRALSAIDNPTSHITSSAQKGTFYNGHLFKFNFLDVFFRVKGSSTASFPDFEHLSPLSREDIRRELLFEQMKLSYIRGLKLHRSLWAYSLSKAWLAVGCIIWLSFLFLKK